jgi:precorrin-3B synthase
MTVANATAVTSIRRACPTVAAPMATGDGLLARLVPHEPIAIGDFVAVCEGSRTCGNGIMEVTQRGSLQIRGLRDDTASRFAEIIGSLDLGTHGPALLTSALLGIEQDGAIDGDALNELVRDLRGALSANLGLTSLGPKVSVLIDSGSALHLDALAADIRLSATRDSLFHLALGGDARSASHAGLVEIRHVVPIVEELLERIAAIGVDARAKDLGLTSFTTGPAERSPAEPIGLHPLTNGRFAQGFGLAFGHSTAEALLGFAELAADLGATSIRPAPGRALLVIDLSREAAGKMCAAVPGEGFVVEPGDPRRYIVACPGAPACAAATLPTRLWAPKVATAVAAFVGPSRVVHLSGCAKGCAHPGPAALTIAGPGKLIVGGRASDPAERYISPAGVIPEVERWCNESLSG